MKYLMRHCGWHQVRLLMPAVMLTATLLVAVQSGCDAASNTSDVSGKREGCEALQRLWSSTLSLLPNQSGLAMELVVCFDHVTRGVPQATKDID
jgi:hypothetical protein